MAAEPDGDFFVAWDSTNQDGSSIGVFGRRYSSDGVALASEFRVNVVTSNAQADASVGASADGDFVVAWQSPGQDDPTGDGTSGFTGTTLTTGAVDLDDCTRCDAATITTYLNGLS